MRSWKGGRKRPRKDNADSITEVFWECKEYAARLKIYKTNLRILEQVLAGKRTSVAKQLEKAMIQASQAEDYERASPGDRAMLVQMWGTPR